MNKSSRFDFHLSEPMRRALDKCSAETGLSLADLTRLGISKLLADHDALPKLPAATEAPR